MQHLFDDIVRRRGGVSSRPRPAWAIVLAGGDGRRLEPVCRARYGYPRPKQYCAFGDDEPLLARTIRRALRRVPEDQVVVSTRRDHRAEAWETLATFRRVRVVEQPENRGTLPGLLLPLLGVLTSDPDATVLVLPSDHHIADDGSFADYLGQATSAVAAHPERVLLLGARLEDPEEGYGWILPDRPRAQGPLRVTAFREKPPADEVPALIAQGALVNTFVMACKARTLARLARRRAPRWWSAACDGVFSPESLTEHYERLPQIDFSRRVLERHIGDLLVMPMQGVGWSDVGTPERLARSLEPAPERVAAPGA